MNPTFWQGKQVLVTGHTGFKGAWLCMLLDSFGARVAGYALDPPTHPSLYELARVDELVDSTVGDVRDLKPLSERVRAFAPGFVFHMAAQSVVLRSYDDPVETYSTNVLGTVHVLEAVRRMGRPCTVINVTTDKCYENKGQVNGYREGDALGGHDPYSNSKACAELVGDAYRESFFPLNRRNDHGVGLASARAGNVIGGGDWTARQLVPDTIASFLQSQAVVLRHPQAVRPWQHVLDCLAGYLTLAEALAEDVEAYSGAWNFGPTASDSRPVSYVVETLAAHWGTDITWVKDGAHHAPEEEILRLDVTKAAKFLGWRSRLPIDDALRWVAHWYRDFNRGSHARDLCHEHIGAYLQLSPPLPSNGRA
ncbi:MAG: CDP-glucose 4,6-dehydratase [Burkholderiaceae bacterium]